MTSAPHRSQRSLLKLGDLSVDLARATVRGSDGPSGMTLRAEDLLLLLCRNANAVVAREEILDHVWSGTVVEEAVITNCVWQIRKALGDAHKHLLQTRIKRGYMLVVPEDAWHANESADDAASSAVALSAPAHALQEPDRPAPACPPGEGDRADADESAESAAIAIVAPDEEAPVAVASHAAPRPSSSVRAFWWSAAALALVSVIGAFAFMREMPPAAASVPIRMQTLEPLRVSIIAEDRYEPLRAAILRTAVEQTYLRDRKTMLFSAPQFGDMSESPRLHVEIRPLNEAEIVADIRIDQAGASVRDTFRGLPEGAAPAVRDVLVRALPAATKRPGPGMSAYVEAVVAELRFRSVRAISEYRHALALEPGLVEAKIALTRIDFAQGRWRDATASAERLIQDDSLTRAQRCELGTLLLDVAPDKLRGRAMLEKTKTCML